MELVPPDFRDQVSVKDHLTQSMLLAVLLEKRLFEITRGACSAYITAEYYPDLFVGLVRRSASTPLESDRSNCLLNLLGAMPEMRVDGGSLRAAARRLMEMHWLVPFSAVSEAFANAWEALASIYEVGTVMNALVSVGPLNLGNVDLVSFMSWFDRQRAQRRDAIFPLPVCRPHGETRAKIVSLGRPELTSSVVPPGVIRMRTSGRKILNRRPLTRLVVLGSAEEPPAGSFGSCEEKLVAVPPSQSKKYDTAPPRVRIKCFAISPMQKDRWAVFYCDPDDCRTETEEMDTAAYVFAMLGSLNDRGAVLRSDLERGPYLIQVESSLK